MINESHLSDSEITNDPIPQFVINERRESQIMRKNRFFISLTVFIWEFIGTIFFAYSVIQAHGNQFAIAGSMTAAVLFSIQLTGSHFNPAIVFDLLLRKKVSLVLFVYYNLAEYLGSFIAAAFVYSLTGSVGSPYATASTTKEYCQQIIVDTFGSMMLTLFKNIQTTPVSKVTKDYAIFALYFFGCMYTSRLYAITSGSVLNPAMAISIQLFNALTINSFGNMNNLWIFVLGPYLGATLAYYFFEFVYLPFLLKLKHLEII